MDQEQENNINNNNTPETAKGEDLVTEVEAKTEEVISETGPEIGTETKEVVSEVETEIGQPEEHKTNQLEEPKTSHSEELNDGRSEEQNTNAEEPSKAKKVAVLLLMILLILAVIGVGVWYFFIKPTEESKSDQAAIQPTANEQSKLALQGNGLSDFDFTFLKLNNNSENTIYSPLSIKYALGMLADAAANDSKTQITNLLGDYQPKAYLNSANMSLANAMFVRTGSGFTDLIKDSYVSTLKTKYGASVIDDSFESPNNVNKWISDQTLGIIDNMFTEKNINASTDFVLVNALAIDMEWNNQLQCTSGVADEIWQNKRNEGLLCKRYYVNYIYDHENYNTNIDPINAGETFSKLEFNGGQEVAAAEVGVSANRYDIIKELGEDYIRETVQKEYEKWLQSDQAQSLSEEEKNSALDMDQYMKELASNYGKLNESTDFYFYDSEAERIFAKDLQRYDGSTLQYIGLMPKSENLDEYISSLTAENVANLIGSLKKSSEINSYKDGVVTKVHAYIPFFNFSYEMDKLKDDLIELGVENVFSKEKADLSNMADLAGAPENAYIQDAAHKADIDFSNDGIKAAAVTGMVGFGSTGPKFNYVWDVPVEEIDLTFDKPFFFLIRDKVTGEVWFTGTVYNPEA